MAMLLALVFAVAVAGCGKDKPNDSEQIETTLKTYYKAFGTGDSGGACDELTKETREELEKAGGGKDCTEILDQALKRPDYAKVAPKLAGVQVSAGTIAGDKATAKTTGPGVGKRTTVPPKKEAGGGKIASPVGEWLACRGRRRTGASGLGGRGRGEVGSRLGERRRHLVHQGVRGRRRREGVLAVDLRGPGGLR